MDVQGDIHHENPQVGVGGDNEVHQAEPVAELHQNEIDQVAKQNIAHQNPAEHQAIKGPVMPIKAPGNPSSIVGKILQPVTARASVSGFGKDVKRTNEHLREWLESPQAVDPPGHWLKYTTEKVEIVSGSEGKERRLEGLFFTSTATAPPGVDQAQWKATNQTILICSGSHESNENYVVPMVQSLTKLGHNVMVFNYSGFGKSEGKATEKHIYEDSVAAYDKMQDIAAEKGIDPNNSAKAIGYSLGGAAVGYLGTVRDVDVVLERTFDKMTTPVENDLKERGFPKKLRNVAKKVFNNVTTFDTESRIQSLKGRALFVRAEEDAITPQAYWKKIEGWVEEKPQKFANLTEVPGGHKHDPSFISGQKSLWYGSSPTNDARRNQLDGWLREPSLPPPPEQVA